MYSLPFSRVKINIYILNIYFVPRGFLRCYGYLVYQMHDMHRPTCEFLSKTRAKHFSIMRLRVNNFKRFYAINVHKFLLEN